MHCIIVVSNSRGNCVWPVGSFLGGIAVVLYGMVAVTRQNVSIPSYDEKMNTFSGLCKRWRNKDICRINEIYEWLNLETR